MPANMAQTRIVSTERDSTERVDANICVVGAGVSGVSATLEASRLGRKVAHCTTGGDR